MSLNLHAQTNAALKGDSLNPLRNDSAKKEIAAQKEANKKAAAKTTFMYFVIKSGDGATFGYDVYADGNLLLHQPSIPAMTGNSGFSDTTSAGKIARLAIQKIREGEMPPTITEGELLKLGVIQKK